MITKAEQMIDFARARARIEAHRVEENSRRDHAEIHTPFALIEEMLDQLPKSAWSDPDRTFLDPAAGVGNFGLVIVERLMHGLESHIPGAEARYRHILANQLYQVELQESNVRKIIELFDVTGDIVLNLKCADALALPYEHMTPEDWRSSAKTGWREIYRTDYHPVYDFFEYSGVGV